MNRTLWPHENLLTTACIDRRYFIELTLLQSLIKIKTVKETIFKAQVYNGSEKTTVKQHKNTSGFSLGSSEFKICSVIFACVLTHETISK